MKSSNRVRRAAFGCAVVLMVATTSAWAGGGKCHQPGDFTGAWVGVWEGPSGLYPGTNTRIEWLWTTVPTDPSGRTCVMNVQWLTVGTDFEALWTILDAHNSQVAGRAEKVGHDTWRFTLIWYNLSNEHPREIVAIHVMSGETTLVGRNKQVTTATLKIYLTNSGVNRVAPVMPDGNPWPYGDADVDHDLLPDAGAVPFNTIQYSEGSLTKRVPMAP